MSREEFWENSDGLRVGFGPRGADNPEGAPMKTEGLYKQHIKTTSFENIGETDTAVPSGDDQPLRPNSVVTRAHFIVTEAFESSDGTATLNIGTKDGEGATIDVDAFDADIAEADLSEGAIITLDGDIVNSSTIIDEAPYITFTWGTEEFTAGAGKIVVEYLIEPSPEA